MVATELSQVRPMPPITKSRYIAGTAVRKEPSIT